MIGLFLGDTDFSNIVLNKIKRKKKKYFIIDFSKNGKLKKDKNSHRISIGRFGEIINLIKEKKSNKVLFAGKIAKPKFSSLRLDLKGIYYMPSVIKAAKLGDAAIIKAIIKILNNEKIKVISSIYFNPELAAKKGNLTKLKPSLTMEHLLILMPVGKESRYLCRLTGGFAQVFGILVLLRGRLILFIPRLTQHRQR